jgi:hypothetical protein
MAAFFQLFYIHYNVRLKQPIYHIFLNIEHYLILKFSYRAIIFDCKSDRLMHLYILNQIGSYLMFYCQIVSKVNFLSIVLSPRTLYLDFQI